MVVVLERFTPEARRVLVLAEKQARSLNQSFIGTEHLLLGLIEEGDGLGAKVLSSLGVSSETVRGKIKETIGPAWSAPVDSPPLTPRAKRALELSLREALYHGQKYIGTEHMLLGLLRDGEGVGVQVLVSLGTDLTKVRAEVLEEMRTAEPPQRAVATTPASEPNRPERERELQDRMSNARDLWKARAAARMTVEELAEASDIEVERLRDAESAEPQDDLTYSEWKCLAVVLEGHTLDEYQAQAMKMGKAGWVAVRGHKLAGMRKMVGIAPICRTL
jgi:ATP-dependent Clp protease ATP-binding subunit ClpA